MLLKESYVVSSPAEVYLEKEIEPLLSNEMAALCFANLQYSAQCLVLSKEEEAKDDNIFNNIRSYEFFDIVYMGWNTRSY